MKKKKDANKEKKRSSKNLRINTRIALTSVLAIVIPLILITTFSTVLVYIVPSYFNFSSVTTNTYSAINQLQWTQTISSIATELVSDDEDDEKLYNLSHFVSPLENVNSLIYIERDGEVFYQTDTDENIPDLASRIKPANTQKNFNYFGNDGLVIVNYMQKSDSSPQYKIIIVNSDYTVNDASQKLSAQELTRLLLGRTGIIILIIVLLFVTAIGVISFITTQTIVNPIKKISHGADEIACGNLDYEIDYKSTNELGKTVDSFNDMRIRLKESIEKQKKAEEERKILVAGIAHDLRTPLTSVKGYAEGLADGIANTPEKQKMYVKTICESISATEKILDDLLTISRLELNGYELNQTDISVKEFFDDGAEEIKQLLDTAGFDFEYLNKCADNTTICIDADRFSRVISNIISNSIKYAKENVKGKVNIVIDEYERSVIIEISDNGIGVEKKSLSKIFDIMYRTDPARTKISQGSGLGLAVCKQIVELHSGSIWARSEEGEGLSIFISLPKNHEDNKNEVD
ncbi:MAG: HAMP domain-containing histidine kinase [Eubacterium sp.]|nr:HAMP domain-containing histidine kinase [Eubacterium sp.]